MAGEFRRKWQHFLKTWAESVDAALCFGWIDGVRKRIDTHSREDKSRIYSYERRKTAALDRSDELRFRKDKAAWKSCKRSRPGDALAGFREAALPATVRWAKREGRV
jgi:hypothetical protein